MPMATFTVAMIWLHHVKIRWTLVQ